MRIAAGDFGCMWVRVYFNGTEVRRVILADEEAGFIIQHSLDEKGNTVIHCNEIQTQRRCGIVRLLFDTPEHEAMVEYQKGLTTCSIGRSDL